MTKDGRKVFFSGLLTALLILSNILALKITVIAKLPLACSVFVYPFTFLCTTVITELYGNKSSLKSVFSAIIVQILVIIAIAITINVPNQIDTITEANALATLFGTSSIGGKLIPALRPIFASIIAFGISQSISIALYKFARKNTFKTVSAALSILLGIIIDAVIFILISKMGTIPSNELIIQLVNQFVVGVVATVIIVPIFLLFSMKKKEVKIEQNNN